MATLPFALTGGVWLLYLLGYNQSVARGVGFIARAGVAAEFGVVMLLDPKHAFAARTDGHGVAGGRESALLRVRPKETTVEVLVAGFIPPPDATRIAPDGTDWVHSLWVARSSGKA